MVAERSINFFSMQSRGKHFGSKDSNAKSEIGLSGEEEMTLFTPRISPAAHVNGRKAGGAASTGS